MYADLEYSIKTAFCYGKDVGKVRVNPIEPSPTAQTNHTQSHFILAIIQIMVLS